MEQSVRHLLILASMYTNRKEKNCEICTKICENFVKDYSQSAKNEPETLQKGKKLL